MKRRKFIELSAAGSAAMASTIYLPGFSQDRKLKIGLIGAGWYGMVDIKAALKTGGVDVVALCDVDSAHLNSSADEIEKLQGRRPKIFKFYQELLDIKGLEAVFIGTIPHWHALQFIAACNKGLDIYCEKPLAYDIMEGIAMVNAANKTGTIIQVGFQRRQSKAFAKTKELIESGKIGHVHQVMAQIHYIPVLEDTTIQSPPETLDWDEWCGPAPKLDYRPNIGHKAWRLEKEYGNGHLVDWGIHHIDIIRRIMGEGMPMDFYTKGGINELKGKITTPDTLTSFMTFPEFQLVWQHRLWGTGEANREFNNGIFFHGDKGSLFAEDSRVTIFPAGRDAQKEVLSIPTEMMQEKHVENFLLAVRNKDKRLLTCTPEDAFQSTATVQLAMISYYTGTAVKWDIDKKEIIGNAEASKQLKREYRGKLVHP
ncbi:MAG TPA: Gfo/Idh/MocA family oxidoreductase [Bacteroidales bacterium]|nr:Gfo/Idh/MocA family oxidoreductase [Bacteroidales bacterium]